MVYRFQSGEHAHLAQSLEMVLANVLRTKRKQLVNGFSAVRVVRVVLTNMVVRKSNLWKNCVMNMCISKTLVTSFFSTSRSTSMNHSKCLCDGHIHRKYTLRERAKTKTKTNEKPRCVRASADPVAYFFTRHSGIAVGRRAEHQIVEDGRVRGDAYAASDHDRHLELVPVLVSAAERSLEAYLRNANVRRTGR